jgi:hypothetical protein
MAHARVLEHRLAHIHQHALHLRGPSANSPFFSSPLSKFLPTYLRAHCVALYSTMTSASPALKASSCV